MRKPLAREDAISCERQAFVFQHRYAGREVLHGSAVHLPWGILCICGESGVGKSTLAAALSRHTYAILADDDIVVCEEADCHRLRPNYFGSRLTETSSKLLGLANRNLASEFPGSDKWIWPGKGGTSFLLGRGEAHAIWGFVILEWSDACSESFKRAKGAAAFESLWGQIKFPWMNLPRWRARQFRAIANLANSCAVFRWQRNVESDSPRAHACRLLEILAARRKRAGAAGRAMRVGSGSP